MKKIINGKLYNTDTAREVADWSPDIAKSDFNYYHETLYRKRTGEYFIYGEGGPASKYAKSAYGAWESGEDIIPLTQEQAEKEASDHLDADDYMGIFGPVSEGGSLRDVHIQVNEKQYAALKQQAAENGTSMREVINQALNEFLG